MISRFGGVDKPLCKSALYPLEGLGGSYTLLTLIFSSYLAIDQVIGRVITNSAALKRL
jgi:hypothetical protein